MKVTYLPKIFFSIFNSLSLTLSLLLPLSLSLSSSLPITLIILLYFFSNPVHCPVSSKYIFSILSYLSLFFSILSYLSLFFSILSFCLYLFSILSYLSLSFLYPVMFVSIFSLSCHISRPLSPSCLFLVPLQYFLSSVSHSFSIPNVTHPDRHLSLTTNCISIIKNQPTQ